MIHSFVAADAIVISLRHHIQLNLMQGNGKAFCAGGDVLASYTCLVAGENHLPRKFNKIIGKCLMPLMFISLDEAGHWSYGTNFYKKQAMLDYLVATYGKPVVYNLFGSVIMQISKGNNSYLITYFFNPVIFV